MKQYNNIRKYQYASHHQSNSDTNRLQRMLEPSQCGKRNNPPLIEVYEIGFGPPNGGSMLG